VRGIARGVNAKSAFVTGCILTLIISYYHRSQKERDLSVVLEKIQSSSNTPDEETLKRIAALPELEGKVVQALLACIGTRINHGEDPLSGKNIDHPASSDSNKVPRPDESAHQESPRDSQIKITPAPEDAIPKSPFPPKEESPRELKSQTSSSISTFDAFDAKRFFCQSVIGSPTRSHGQWNEVFPSSRNNMGSTWGFGLAQENFEADKPENFLSARQCLKPQFYPLQKREDLPFFKRLARLVFQGPFKWSTKKGAHAPTMHLHFNESDRDRDREYLAIYANDGKLADDLFENRIFQFQKSESEKSDWRWNGCSRAMTLLGDQCPWSAEGDLEYKDFFYHDGSQQLVGNAYCRKKKSNEWFLAGTFVLKISLGN